MEQKGGELSSIRIQTETSRRCRQRSQSDVKLFPALYAHRRLSRSHLCNGSEDFLVTHSSDSDVTDDFSARLLSAPPSFPSLLLPSNHY